MWIILKEEKAGRRRAAHRPAVGLRAVIRQPISESGVLDLPMCVGNLRDGVEVDHQSKESRANADGGPEGHP
ncbi:hypothetical protein [Thioclava sp. GXIMD4215]|uniref:hypothetical protein n=1 Tax=Thioclava sp. GXIMD4215 TaxID=3131928 RepID=UPI00324D0472